MRTLTLLASALACALASPSLQAQTYLVRTKERPAEGKSVDVAVSSANRMTVIAAVGGKVLKEEKEDEIEEKQFNDKVLEAGKDRPKKYSQTFTKAVKGPRNAPVQQSYAGKTIVYELKNDQYVASAVGGGVSDKDLSDFTKSANMPKVGQLMYADGPVKLGEPWKISRKALKLMLGEEAEQSANFDQAVATGRLLKVYKKNDQQWGTVEVIAHVPYHKMGPIALSRPIEAQMRVTLETAIDGSSLEGDLRGSITMKGRTDFVQNKTTIVLDLDAVIEHRQVQSAEK